MKWSTILVGKWSWYRPLVSIGFIYILLALYAVFFAERMIFIPPPSSYNEAEPDLVLIESETRGVIAAIHLPAIPGMPTILYSHGNAEDIGHSRELYEIWHEAGLGVLAYDYPGYGLSDGRPTEHSVNLAAKSAWNHLIENGITPESIVIAGRSVGSGPACRLAADVEAGGLVLISPFTSAYAVMIPPWLLPRDRFRNLTLMPDIRCPLLIIHGEKDSVISAAHGEKLYESSGAKHKTWLPVPAAGHNDIFYLRPDLIDKIAEFTTGIANP